jgi:hypothetical protein
MGQTPVQISDELDIVQRGLYSLSFGPNVYDGTAALVYSHVSQVQQ